MRLATLPRLAGSWLALCVLLSPSLYAQAAKKANEGYRTEEGRARVARALESADRVERQKPAELVASLGIAKGSVIADIGTGVGFMLPYLVEAAGPEGTVWATDIQQDFLSKADKKIRSNGWKNVKTVLGTQTDPKLPEGGVDLGFILDAYHHFDEPAETLANIRRSLKPGGRLVIVDFYRSREHPRMSAERLKGHIRLDRDGFRTEIEKAGFRLARQFDHLPHQYVLIFTKD